MDAYLKMYFVFITGIMGFTYVEYAVKKGWPIGSLWLKEFSIPGTHGFMMTILGFVLSFFLMKWYLVFVVLIAAFFTTYLIMGILKTYTQYLWFLMYLPATLFVFQPIYNYLFK